MNIAYNYKIIHSESFRLNLLDDKSENSQFTIKNQFKWKADLRRELGSSRCNGGKQGTRDLCRSISRAIQLVLLLDDRWRYITYV